MGFLKIDQIDTEIDNHLKDIAFTIGNFLSSFQNDDESELTILGKPGDTWKKLIELLTRIFQEIVKDNNRVDRIFTEFFESFNSSILYYHTSRNEILRIGGTLDYKSFRRTLFKKLSKDKAILNKLWSREGELLVKTLANLWELDRSWIFSKQTRLNNFKEILEYLQSKNVEGSRILSENVANNLA